jgi:hypothetical protein
MTETDGGLEKCLKRIFNMMFLRGRYLKNQIACQMSILGTKVFAIAARMLGISWVKGGIISCYRAINQYKNGRRE